MKALMIPLALMALLAGPAAAQDEDPGTEEELQDGLDLLSEGARQVMRGLMGEVEPRMRELAEALEAWDFRNLDIEDLGQYHPPEKLPNGDIIIRRKTPTDPDNPDNPMDGEIEL